MNPPITAIDYLLLVEQSGLLDEAALAPYREAADAGEASDRTSGSISRKLIADRLLTAFQARKLAKGRFRGFFLAGKYKILDEIGEGGMGRVLLCEHLILRRLVAIKLMTLSPDAFPGAVERFVREARAAAALDHRNITRVFDVEQTEAGPCMVMEYVDGISLQDLVNRHGPLTIERAAHYISQSAAGLQHAHEAGLVHRDVKPGNILIDRSGTIKLLDLGLARFFEAKGNDDLTQKFDDKAVLGTADYIAPEQAVNSSRVDIRADIYSLGCTLHFLLTGKPPFEGGTMVEKLMCHQGQEPPEICTLRPEVPAELAEVLSRTMRKRADERYQTPAELIPALSPWTKKPIASPRFEEMTQAAPQSFRLGLSPPPRITARKSKSDDATPAPSASDRDTHRKSDVRLATMSVMEGVPMALPDSSSFLATGRSALDLPEPVQTRIEPSRRRQPPVWQIFAISATVLGVLSGFALGLVSWISSDAEQPSVVSGPVDNLAARPDGQRSGETPIQPAAVAGVVLRAGGSSFIAPLMEHWTPLFESASGARLEYASLGSSKGVEGVINHFFEFGCTDAFLTDEQLAKAEGTMMHVPLAMGAVVPTYNVTDEHGHPLQLRFTGPVLANIYLGRIKNWNDPAITVTNPGKTLPDLPIKVVHRSDGSGTTSIWTDYLSKASSEWKSRVGAGNKVEWPTGQGADKNDGVADTVSRLAGAIGYVELSFALTNGLPVGRVKNKAGVFIEPSIESVTAAAAGSLQSIPADLRYSLTDAPGKSSYPIAGSCWAVAFVDQSPEKRAELVKFLRWATHEGQHYVRDLRYAPLPAEFMPRIDAVIQRLEQGR